MAKWTPSLCQTRTCLRHDCFHVCEMFAKIILYVQHSQDTCDNFTSFSKEFEDENCLPKTYARDSEDCLTLLQTIPNPNPPLPSSNGWNPNSFDHDWARESFGKERNGWQNVEEMIKQKRWNGLNEWWGKKAPKLS